MEGSGDRRTILVVDDTPANLRLLTGILESAGYKVKPAPSGKLALQATRSDPPDLVLLDISMPEMDGFEVCRKLKEDGNLSNVPVLFISALTDTEDKITAFKAGGLDYITKPFQAEEVLARVRTHLQIVVYQRMLQEQNETLTQTLGELKATQDHLVQSEKMASLGVLTAGIAHEINNPINFIKSSAHALHQDLEDIMKLLQLSDECNVNCPDDKLRQEIFRIKEEIDYEILVEEITGLVNRITLGVNRTEEIIKSLRTYAREDSEKKVKTDVEELLDTTLVLLKNRYDQNISLTKNYHDLPPIPLQPGRLSQVFSNVISNAIDAVSDSQQNSSPAIAIETGLETVDGVEYVSIRTIDNGCGIKGEHLDKIFDPFFTTKDVGRGTGLGMSISLGIIQDHNGHINITSKANEGTTVLILLPIAEAKQ